MDAFLKVAKIAKVRYVTDYAQAESRANLVMICGIRPLEAPKFHALATIQEVGRSADLR